MARSPGHGPFEASFPGSETRLTIEGDAGQSVLATLIAGAAAPGLTPEDLHSPDVVVRRVSDHLGTTFGVDRGRLVAIFDRIVASTLPGGLPTGASLLTMLASGPLSWPRRVLCCRGIADPLSVLEREEFIALPGRLAATEALVDVRTPLVTRRELSRLLAAFADHLERNAASLVRTGHPTSLFARCPWLDVRLNKLYPLNIPFVIGEHSVDRRDVFDPRYVEGRRVSLPLSRQHLHRRSTPACPVLDHQVVNPTPAASPTWGRWANGLAVPCPYLEADLFSGLHEDDADWLESTRPAVHEVKVEALVEMANALAAGDPGRVWPAVLRVLTRRLDGDSVRRLLRLDAKYQRYDAWHDDGGLEPLPCMPGGVSAVIDLAGHCEKELSLGTLHFTREALAEHVVPDPVGRPTLVGGGQSEPYFTLAAGAAASRCLAALDIYLDIEGREPAHWVGFRREARNSLAPVPRRDPVVPVRLAEVAPIPPAAATQIQNLAREVDEGIPSPTPLPSQGGRLPGVRAVVPSGIDWPEVTITFLTGETVEIVCRGQRRRHTYAELGFADGRRADQPDQVWAFFKLLATQDGTLSWATERGVPPNFRKNAATYAKKLRKRLKVAFSIDEDPFEPYRTAKSYRTRFTLRSRI